MRRTLGLLLAFYALASCGGDGSTNAIGTLEITGRIERGSSVQVVLKDANGGSQTPAAVTITPASAGTVTGNTILLNQTGVATITATDGGRSASVSVTVATPPTIFFDAVDQGNRDIYSAALDGQELHRWTTDVADDQEPSVAKGLMVFSSTRTGSFDLYSLLLAGGPASALTSATGNELQPSLSNDATRLVYTSDATGLARLYLASANATGATLLTAAAFGNGSGLEVTAKWSPAGDKLVLAATPNGRTNLFTASPTGGTTPASLTGSTPQFTDVEPAWSPDGNRVVFASTRAGGTSLFIVDTRNGAVTQLTSGSTDGQPVWIADGRVVFTRFANSGSTLAWIDPDNSSSGVHAITLPYASAQHATVER